jgi:putative RNA 2'-phosphotransferase
MENEKRLIHMGKQLSFLLRHDSEAFSNGLIDKHGWRKVSELAKDHKYTKDLLDDIVKTNNKQRYEYNEDHTKIRARQGHSIPVNVELKEMTPPDVLYHGTASRFVESILKDGLKPMTRLYVHLSSDMKTAIDVGSRHGKPVVFSIDAKQMYDDGIKFYLSNNGVWLTKYVDVKYLSSKF